MMLRVLMEPMTTRYGRNFCRLRPPRRLPRPEPPARRDLDRFGEGLAFDLVLRLDRPTARERPLARPSEILALVARKRQTA